MRAPAKTAGMVKLATTIVGVTSLLALVFLFLLPRGHFTEEDNRVFQQIDGRADVELEWVGTADAVQLSGIEYAATSASGRFSAVPAGWYTARLYRNGIPGRSINIGVGDVYVVAGQSNSIAQVQPEGYRPDVPPGPGRVILNRFYAPGLRDAYADPLKTYLYDAGVTWLYAGLALNHPHPVMFVMVGLGNTSTERWARPGTYQRIIDAVAAYGPKAILWHQGESDCTVPPAPWVVSYANMVAMIDGVSAVTSVSWIMAINSTGSPPPDGLAEWPIRQAQREIIQKYRHVHRGPDTDTIRAPGEYEYLGRSLKRHGGLWAMTMTALGL